jgi:hypothetical protein
MCITSITNAFNADAGMTADPVDAVTAANRPPAPALAVSKTPD